MPRIAIIGYGVVGRALGEVLAVKIRGAEVHAYDSKVIGRVAGKVRLAKTLPGALKGADFIFLCVPSHLKGEGVSGAGWKALAKQMAKYAKLSAIVVIKSTLVPGDAIKLESMTKRRVVVCPEFMSEGTAEREIGRASCRERVYSKV
jgi:UDP-glucose 6-dehydrogenase